MLMNHKNFHFTQIPDKSNDVIFLKSPKPCFWAIFDHFWSFLPDADFFENFGSVTHNYVWAPNTMLSFMLSLKKKLTSQSGENLRTNGRSDGRTEGWTKSIL